MINRKILESVIFIVTIIVSIVFIPILFGFYLVQVWLKVIIK